MPVSVLVVDDSAFFRQRVTSILNKDARIRVVGTAENGQDAIEKTLALRPDVITLDYEMPVMNGISALAEIMKRCPTPVLMFSSLTYEGARITLEALEAGAVDYLPKSYERMSGGQGSLEQVLIERVLTVARSRRTSLAPKSALPAPSTRSNTSPVGGSGVPSRVRPAALAGTQPGAVQRPMARTATAANPLVSSASAAHAASASVAPRPRSLVRLGRDAIVVFGTSTGGPVAIQKVLSELPGSFPLPILIVQHMPSAFTGAFAERLNQQCQIEVHEARDGDRLRPGLALLAPGGQQMMVDSRNGGQVRILAGDDRLNYKPSVDITFGSAAKHYPGRVLGIVLTGMGADGREGARMLKQSGSQIWAQNEQSSVIYGMPQAIVQAQLADQVLDLSEIGSSLIKVVGR